MAPGIDEPDQPGTPQPAEEQKPAEEQPVEGTEKPTEEVQSEPPVGSGKAE